MQVTLLDTLGNLAATRTVADQLLSQAANVSVSPLPWRASLATYWYSPFAAPYAAQAPPTCRCPSSSPLLWSIHFSSYSSTTCRYVLLQ